MVLSVSFAFLASIFPPAANTMMRILNPQWEWLDVIDDVCAILWDFNYAINFYLYVITGRVVRLELLQMMKCGGQRVQKACAHKCVQCSNDQRIRLVKITRRNGNRNKMDKHTREPANAPFHSSSQPRNNKPAYTP